MTKEQTRRNVMIGTTVVAAALAATALPKLANAQAAGAPKVEYTPKKLPFDPSKVKGLSEKILTSHYENN
jgi:Fe-Mn family superoxide dismutase